MRCSVVAATLALLLLPVACSGSIDAEQERVCRAAIPALNPDGTAVEVSGALPGPLPSTIRLDYTAKLPNGSQRNRLIICRFASTGLAADKSRLTGIATERGPMSDANFYFLKRFYLDEAQREGVRQQPAGAKDGLIFLSPGFGAGLQQVLAALPLTAIYGLLAASYALVFGLVGRINLAFGEFAVLGGAAATLGVALTLAAGSTGPAIGLGAGLVLALLASSLHGLVAGRLAVSPLLFGSGQRVLIATIGLALALSEYLRLAQGSRVQWLPPVFNESLAIARTPDFLVTVTPIALGVTATGLIAAGGLLALMQFSRFGRSWRAFADDPGAAALCGVNGRKLFDLTFLIACGLAGLAGFVMTAFYGGIGYAAGLGLGLKALVAAVLGGIGSISGAFLGGVVIGLAEALWSATMPIESRDIAIYALLVVILIFRPGGLFGQTEELPRSAANQGGLRP